MRNVYSDNSGPKLVNTALRLCTCCLCLLFAVNTFKTPHQVRCHFLSTASWTLSGQVNRPFPHQHLHSCVTGCLPHQTVE